MYKLVDLEEHLIQHLESDIVAACWYHTRSSQGYLILEMYGVHYRNYTQRKIDKLLYV